MNDADSKKLEEIKENGWHSTDIVNGTWIVSKLTEQDREIGVLLQQASDREMWKADAEKAVKHIEMLLLIIKHETDLPAGAANGNVAPNGQDEGIVMTANILDEARVFVERLKEQEK